MVRIFNVSFPKRTVFLLVSEGALICLALVSAVFLCLGAGAQSAFSDQHAYLKVAIVGMICFFCIHYSDVYDPSIVSDRREVPFRLIHGLGIACLVVALVYYAFPSCQICRGFAIVGIPLTGIFLIANRQLFFALNSSNRFTESALIMGEGPLATSLAREIQTRPELGIRLTGYLGRRWEPESSGSEIQHLGGIEDLSEVLRRSPVERIIVAMGDRRSKMPVAELLALKTSGVMIQEGSDFYEITTGKLPIDTLRLSWLIFSPGFRVSRLTLLYKRLFSLLLAGIASVVLFPLMALAALAIWLDSPGPVIFRQERIGKDGLPFMVFKFRTMRVGADSGGDPLPVQINDARITRVGRWLRRIRLDETPQLYNILLGQMYFIGPRPFVPSQELELARRIPLYTQRWTVKPGVTGWAQVQRGYCATFEDNNEKLAYDLFYIKNMSIGLDLLILFNTIKIVLLGRGAR
ncbi:MAG: sugar transferase [Candidatus Acidiferrales bacterium]